jgi:hypothetical protein
MEEKEEKIIPNEAVTTPRSRQFMSGKYPDNNWASDEEYETALADHLEDADRRLAGYAETDEQIARILDMNPDFALVLQDMGKGVPFRVALRRHVEDLTPVEGDEDYSEYIKAAEEYATRKKELDDRIATRTANLEESDKTFAQFIDSQGWDEQKKQGYIDFVSTMVETLETGVVSTDVLQMFSNAYTHDDDVAEALEEGQIEGRNQKIRTQRVKQNNVDGVPAGGGSAPATPKPRAQRVIDIGAMVGLTDEEVEAHRRRMQ